MKTCLVCNSNLVQYSVAGVKQLICINKQCSENLKDKKEGEYKYHELDQKEILHKKASSQETEQDK